MYAPQNVLSLLVLMELNTRAGARGRAHTHTHTDRQTDRQTEGL